MATIKEIPAELRPYEKVLKYGPKNLDDSELLAVILRTGTKGMSSVDLSRNIISAGGGRLSGMACSAYRRHSALTKSFFGSRASAGSRQFRFCACAR